jgi:hypothetical protein
MIELPRLTQEQQALVCEWLPQAEFVADLSWELMGTAVLHLRTPDGDRIVKAGGPTNHHIGRERNAHLGFTGPWLAQGRAAPMLASDPDTNMLLLDYLPGELAQGHAAECDPETYRQAGAMLAAFHGQAARPDPDYEARMTRKAIASLDTPHRIAQEPVDRLRQLLLSVEPEPVTLVPTHGDWHPRNWLIDNGFVRAIDFGRFDWRPALTDFARLAVRQFAANPTLEAAFLEGYGADPRTPELWRILQIREAIGTAVWAYQVGDEPFEQEGHRMIANVLSGEMGLQGRSQGNGL